MVTSIAQYSWGWPIHGTCSTTTNRLHPMPWRPVANPGVHALCAQVQSHLFTPRALMDHLLIPQHVSLWPAVPVPNQTLALIPWLLASQTCDKCSILFAT